MFIGKLINQSDAFVAGWLPGTQARGVADILWLVRMISFTGRLPFVWPANAISPIKNPLFDSGYGLSYANLGTLVAVNEAAGVDQSSVAQSTNFVVRGKIPAPWHLSIDGSISTRPVVNLLTQSDSGASLSIDWRVDQLGNGPV